MTPLADEILRILESEGKHPPLSAESLSRVLWFTGFGGTAEPIPVPTIEGAIRELQFAGRVEVVWRRGTAYYRALRSVEARSHEAGT